MDGVHVAGKILGKADSIFAQIRELEAKQSQVRETMVQLKRSLFHKMAQELEEEKADRYDRRRFDLFWLYVEMVLGKKTCSIDEMRFQEQWELAGIELKHDGTSSQEMSNWLIHWRDQGELVCKPFPGKDHRHREYSLVEQAS